MAVVQGCFLLNDGLRSLCTALPFLPQLANLGLCDNGLSETGVNALLEACRQGSCPVLRQVNLQWNSPGAAWEEKLQAVLHQARAPVL